MPAKRRPTRDGVEILHRRFYARNPERIADLDEARATAAIARQVFNLREKAGLTRGELADRVGTSAAAIRCLEEDDYEGQPLDLLRRIARALGRRVEIRLVTWKTRRRPA